MKRTYIPTRGLLPILMIACTWLSACSYKDILQQPKTCLESRPESIAGLEIEGPRSAANVIMNMWPVVCKSKEIYRERLKTNLRLAGTIELKLSVEFNGEIGPYSIEENTMEDRVFKRQFLRQIQFMDFDPYGPDNSETEILFPFHFEP